MVDELARRRMRSVWGEAGERWLADLPTLIAQCCDRWQLTLEGQLPQFIHWVGAARCADNTPAVLKLGLPDGHLDSEITALQAYAGGGAVRLLSFDASVSALLLERAVPGITASTMVPGDDARATGVIVDVARRLHRAPLSIDLPPLSQQMNSLSGYLSAHGDTGPVPSDLVRRALGVFGDLCASADRSVLLHGDLHHDNVLSSHRDGWLAIDPHGVVGDPGYEFGAMLYNPYLDERDRSLLSLVSSRIDVLTDMSGVARERLLAWGFVKSVLSEVWTVHGGGQSPTRALDVARTLAPQV